jgi:hypothetical protein
MGAEPQKLVDSKELINLYLDISEEIFSKLTFDKSNLDITNRFLFFLSLEKSFDCLADSILNQMGIDLPDAESLNAKAKWNKLALEPSLKNIIFKEQQPDGFIFDFYNVKDKLYTPVNDSIIISNQTNNLKKYFLILDSYKRFTLLLRKTLDEC